jgi:hypothetical protein
MSDDADHVHDTTVTDPTHGTWIRCRVGSETFLGRVYQLDFQDPYTFVNDNPEAGEPSTHRKQACSARAVLEARVITLFPAYAFAVSESRVPIMDPATRKPAIDPETHLPASGISRQPILRGVDFNLHPVMLHVVTGGGAAIYIFSQQHKNDQATLRDFCKHIEDTNKKHREEALAQSSGLVPSATPEQAAAEAERIRRVRRG